MAGEFDSYEGRRPSFRFTRNGPVLRGFRSRPGAPMHDPTNNVPMSRGGLTPPAQWADLFKPRMGQGSAPAPAAAPMPETSPGAMGAASGAMGGFGNTLEDVASGGTNHATEWSRPKVSAIRPPQWEAPTRRDTDSIFERYKTPSQFKPDYQMSRFGWGSAFA